MIKYILKCDYREVPFDDDKITDSIVRAFKASGSSKGEDRATELTKQVILVLEECNKIKPTEDEVQDVIECVLLTNGHYQTAKTFILDRARKKHEKEMNKGAMKKYQQISIKILSEEGFDTKEVQEESGETFEDIFELAEGLNIHGVPACPPACESEESEECLHGIPSCAAWIKTKETESVRAEAEKEDELRKIHSAPACPPVSGKEQLHGGTPSCEAWVKTKDLEEKEAPGKK
jgi:hypothetical protein